MTKYILLSICLTTVLILFGISNVGSDSRTRSSDVSLSAPPHVFALGTIEGATPEIPMRPQVAGRVTHVFVREGQVVSAGDVLVQLDDEQYRYELELAKADLDLANAQLLRLMNGARSEERTAATALYHAKLARLDNARRQWQRTEQLSRADAISSQAVDDLRAEVEALEAETQAAKAHMETLHAPAREDEVQIAQARVRAARARLRLAEVPIARSRLRAASGGKILKVNVEPGELAGPASAEPTLTLVDTSTLQVRAFVEELDAPRIQVGMHARITADGLPGEFAGRVTHVSPRMGAKTVFGDRPQERHDIRTREIMVSLQDEQGFVVGLQVDVLIDCLLEQPAKQEITAPPDQVDSGAQPRHGATYQREHTTYEHLGP